MILKQLVLFLLFTGAAQAAVNARIDRAFQGVAGAAYSVEYMREVAPERSDLAKHAMAGGAISTVVGALRPRPGGLEDRRHRRRRQGTGERRPAGAGALLGRRFRGHGGGGGPRERHFAGIRDVGALRRPWGGRPFQLPVLAPEPAGHEAACPRSSNGRLRTGTFTRYFVPMPTPHINARPGDFADVVLMPGDPQRAEHIATTFLADARRVTNVRNVCGLHRHATRAAASR